jgi:hypothetical protein
MNSQEANASYRGISIYNPFDPSDRSEANLVSSRDIQKARRFAKRFKAGHPTSCKHHPHSAADALTSYCQHWERGAATNSANEPSAPASHILSTSQRYEFFSPPTLFPFGPATVHSPVHSPHGNSSCSQYRGSLPCAQDPRQDPTTLSSRSAPSTISANKWGLPSRPLVASPTTSNMLLCWPSTLCGAVGRAQDTALRCCSPLTAPAHLGIQLQATDLPGGGNGEPADPPPLPPMSLPPGPGRPGVSGSVCAGPIRCWRPQSPPLWAWPRAAGGDSAIGCGVGHGGAAAAAESWAATTQALTAASAAGPAADECPCSNGPAATGSRLGKPGWGGEAAV